MIRQASPDFVVEAAAYALWSLCGTQVFILSYMIAASRLPVMPSLLLSTAAWVASAPVVRSLPPEPLAGASVYLAVTVLTRLAGSRLAGDTRKQGSAGGLGLLVLRGCLAGLLVAVATGAAAYLGAGWSGILLAYPVGFHGRRRHAARAPRRTPGDRYAPRSPAGDRKPRHLLGDARFPRAAPALPDGFRHRHRRLLPARHGTRPALGVVRPLTPGITIRSGRYNPSVWGSGVFSPYDPTCSMPVQSKSGRGNRATDYIVRVSERID